ncbi:MAG TPA: matrixin family metalloprotease [Candidatus Paenibacillus intestinavium]|nr:matrixin family metalloprotease [Candidatus Paenibacillus intestinavium]
MTIRKKIFSAIIATTLFGGVVNVASAYNHILLPTIYDSKINFISYQVQSTFDSSTKTQISEAITTWNNILPEGFLYKSSIETSATTPSENNINTITKYAYGAQSINAEHIPYTNSKGLIDESDIKVNSSKKWSSTVKVGYLDIKSTMTHEFGHALRVGHSSTYADTMYDYSTEGTDYKRTLTSDDEDAANDSYVRW